VPGRFYLLSSGLSLFPFIDLQLTFAFLSPLLSPSYSLSHIKGERPARHRTEALVKVGVSLSSRPYQALIAPHLFDPPNIQSPSSGWWILDRSKGREKREVCALARGGRKEMSQGMSPGNGGGAGQFGDTTFTKVFVGGLAWETNKEGMRGYFEQFGDILEAVVIADKNTGRSKGYGFVSYELAKY
jgi:hypothetical protein